VDLALVVLFFATIVFYLMMMFDWQRVDHAYRMKYGPLASNPPSAKIVATLLKAAMYAAVFTAVAGFVF
jgi:hypothetical protein